MDANFFYYSIYDRFIQRQPCACMRTNESVLKWLGLARVRVG